MLVTFPYEIEENIVRYINLDTATEYAKVRGLQIYDMWFAQHSFTLEYTKHISILRTLKRLREIHVEIDVDEGTVDLSILKDCVNLASLSVYAASVVNVHTLATCSSLHTLEIYSDSVHDTRDLRFCRALRVVHLSCADSLSMTDLSPRVHSIDLFGTPVLNLSNLLIRNVYLHSLCITNTDLSTLIPFAECTNLSDLNLCGSRVQSLEGIERCKSLNNLNLVSTIVDTGIVEPLRRCRNLTNLQVGPTITVDDIGCYTSLQTLTLVLSRYGHFPFELDAPLTLRTIDLISNRVHSIRPLTACTTLRELHITDSNSIDISPLTDCENLRYLNVHRCGITHLPALPGIHKLDISYTWISSLAALLGNTSLRILNMSYTNVACLKAVSKCTMLHTLYAKYSKIQSIDPLQECSNLRVLDYSNTPATKTETE